MTLTHLSIRDYQSLASVDLALDPFTVIVGPSSSGKSALTRAIRTLCSYGRGSSFVSTWAKRSVIEADIADRDGMPVGRVSLTRGPKTEDNRYVILPPEQQPNAPESVFSKMGGAVPEEVTAFLGILPDSPLTFAGQFDRPYLLADSPAEVARTFAALTNVHTVFAAAREANRTRLERAQRQRIKAEDLEQITARKDEFRTLGTRLKAQNTAEAHMVTARGISQASVDVYEWQQILGDSDEAIERTSRILSRPVPTIERVETLSRDIKALTALHSSLVVNTARLERSQTILDAPVPSLERVEAAAHRLEAYKAVLLRLRAARGAVLLAQQTAEREAKNLIEANEAYQAELRSAGSCPTCGQDTTHLHEVAL